MASIWKKAISILAGNFNLDCSSYYNCTGIYFQKIFFYRQNPNSAHFGNNVLSNFFANFFSLTIKKNSKLENWKFLKVETWNISHISSRLVNVSWVVWPSTYHKKKCRLMNCCDERALAYLDSSFFMMHLKAR